MDRRSLPLRFWLPLLVVVAALALSAGRSSVGQQPAQAARAPEGPVGRYQVAVTAGAEASGSHPHVVVIDTVTGRVWKREAARNSRWVDCGAPSIGAPQE